MNKYNQVLLNYQARGPKKSDKELRKSLILLNKKDWNIEKKIEKFFG